MTCFINGRSHFSLGASLLTPTQIVEEALSKGATSVALTDDMRITGLVELVEACKKNAIKPIIGARLTIVNELTMDRESKKSNRPYYLRAIILTEAGYKAVLALLSRAFDVEHFYEVPRLLLSDVAEVLGGAGSDAVVCTLGDFYGAHAAGKAREVVSTLSAANVSVVSEIVPVPTPHFARLAFEAFRLETELGVPVIMGCPSFYKNADQADSLDLLKVITSNSEWASKHYWREFTPKDANALVNDVLSLSDMMVKLHGSTSKTWREKIIFAHKHTQTIPDMVTYVWDKETPSLPTMAADEFGELVRRCKEGWAKRLTREVFGYQPTDLKPYMERLKYELSVLKKLKFEAYFLLVSDIVTWSKTNGVLVGPGRGSVGGSLVAYLMGITDVDPIRFNLIFERFINPDRIDLPDADLDFMSTRREEVIAYIRAKFGEDYVAAVSNYSTMGAAGVLKDICSKVEHKGNTFAFGKLVPKEHGQSSSLDEAISLVPELVKFADDNPHIIAHARNLEDRMRNYGKHAAGIVVAGVPITERAVVERRSGDTIVNWDKSLVEYFGLVKMDILGLSTLDMIGITVDHIKKLHGKTIDMLGIPLDDKEVLAAFGRGETTGVFQMEAPGAKKMLRDMSVGDPLTFNDISAANALNRPGPMDAGLVSKYIKRRNGEEKVSYAHPALENALRDTFGVLTFQEQLMQISKDLSGFTGPEADTLRKAVGKKDAKLMATMKDKFVSGAVVGYASVELDDGRVVRVHRARLFKVKGSVEKFTIEDILNKNLDIDESI